MDFPSVSPGSPISRGDPGRTTQLSPGSIPRVAKVNSAHVSTHGSNLQLQEGHQYTRRNGLPTWPKNRDLRDTQNSLSPVDDGDESTVYEYRNSTMRTPTAQSGYSASAQESPQSDLNATTRKWADIVAAEVDEKLDDSDAGNIDHLLRWPAHWYASPEAKPLICADELDSSLNYLLSRLQ